ncbi:ferredoxin [Nocardia sp. NPDC051756]|uniref:ferredoxin n=1 Tax=Nocardia sp. NPDC051756 TaxID=3154751 RepID=UPI0034493E18
MEKRNPMEERRFYVDRKSCMGTGLCFGAYPNSFEPVAPNQARVRRESAALSELEIATNNCPTGAIREANSVLGK